MSATHSGLPPALVIDGLVKRFSGRVVSNFPRLELGSHGIEGLVGPNGAGKTTLTKLITGALQPDEGTITHHRDGDPVQLTGMPTHRVAQLGVMKSNQVIQDFESLTIRESMLLAVTPARQERFWRVLGGTRPSPEHQAEIEEYAEYFGFGDLDRQAMSGGEKKLLDIVRCLLAKPRFLLLDEPTAGLPAEETEKVARLVRAKVDAGEMQVLIIEHDLELMWNLCDFVHFMADGEVLLQGRPEEIRENPTVIEKYLGGSHA